MTGSVRVKGTTPDGKLEQAIVWVDKRSAFGLEVVSLVESGICVELESVNVPEDQCITSADIHGTFHWLVMPQPSI